MPAAAATDCGWTSRRGMWPELVLGEKARAAWLSVDGSEIAATGADGSPAAELVLEKTPTAGPPGQAARRR